MSRVARKTKKNKVFPGNLKKASAYAASAEVMTWPRVTASETTKELSTHRPRLLSCANACPKTLQSILPKSGKTFGARVGPCNARDNAKKSGKARTPAA